MQVASSKTRKLTYGREKHVFEKKKPKKAISNFSPQTKRFLKVKHAFGKKEPKMAISNFSPQTKRLLEFHCLRKNLL